MLGTRRACCATTKSYIGTLGRLDSLMLDTFLLGGSLRLSTIYLSNFFLPLVSSDRYTS